MENQTPIPRQDKALHPNFRIEETTTEVMVIIADLQLHTTVSRKPKTFAEGIRKLINSGKPGRTYREGALKITDSLAGTFQITIPLDGLEEVVAKAEAKGKRVRFFVPKNGIPILLGKDAIERMEALKRKGRL